MALARVKVWIPGDILTASDLNAEFNNFINNPISLISPTTGVITFTTAQTFPLGQVVATSGLTGSVISGSTATSSPLVAGTVIIPGTAQLQYNSTTQIQLGLGVIPLKIGTQWIQRAIPTAVTLSATSTMGSTGGIFAANTVFYIYAVDSTGTTILDFATTGAMPHSPSTENGVEVATTDATRTLVGMIQANASTQFSNSSTERFVLSWYTKASATLKLTLSGNVTTTSTSLVEMSTAATESRLKWVMWSSQSAQFNAGLTINNAANDSATAGLFVDGAVVSSFGINQSATGSLTLGAGFSFVLGKGDLAEGAHAVSFAGRTGSVGPVTFLSDGGSDRFSTLSALIV